MKLKHKMNGYNTPNRKIVLARSGRQKGGSFPTMKLKHILSNDSPEELKEFELYGIWLDAVNNMAIRHRRIDVEVIYDFLYNNGYKELFEDED